ncbi:MAG: class I SAM-dependent methyltransferase [Planctomycetes bacterium]|nr:class I SAM-dependent methyltransferase [Planctomycetota bacterium]
MEAVLPYQYVGTELDLFAQATHWKAYLRRQIVPHLGRSVLEVGAGIGGTTRVLFDASVQQWLALEPDFELADRYRQAVENGNLPDRCQIRVGVTQDLQDAGPFDSVLYIDVLEHIEHDRDELTRAAQLLAPGGKLIVLAPAHHFLFCAFDRAVGHYRRYNRRGLKNLSPPGCSLRRLAYLDSAGLLASLGNKLVLRSSMPTLGQIAFWDRMLVPASTWLDPLLGYQVGKSVLAVWQRG